MQKDGFSKWYRREVGSRVRQQRLRLNVCQAGIARHLGVSIATVSCWENGTRPIHVDRLPLIAAYLQARPADFLPQVDPVDV